MVSRWMILILVLVQIPMDLEARRRTPTHPVVLWSRTVASAEDLETRRVAAFKLSQYTQRIFQSSVIRTLLECVKDPDLQIKVFCTKAMRNTGRKRDEAKIRAALLERYRNDPALKNAIIRTWIAREESDPAIQGLLLSDLLKAEDVNHRLTLIRYFRRFGQENAALIKSLVYLYEKYPDDRTQLEIVATLAEKGKGQKAVVGILLECAQSEKTPLVLACLGAMESQARDNEGTWRATEALLSSRSPEVLHGTLDLINDLPPGTHVKVAARLLLLLQGNPEPAIQEKAVLALGATGDKGQEVVAALSRIVQDKGRDEGSRIAAALSLGRQATLHKMYPLKLLNECKRSGATQAFRTACQIGLTELQAATKKATSE